MLFRPCAPSTPSALTAARLPSAAATWSSVFLLLQGEIRGRKDGRFGAWGSLGCGIGQVPTNIQTSTTSAPNLSHSTHFKSRSLHSIPTLQLLISSPPHFN